MISRRPYIALKWRSPRRSTVESLRGWSAVSFSGKAELF
jgi:hypothetical protein